MGAKLAAPDKLCVNVWGDAAIGFTGMDFETAVRERILGGYGERVTEPGAIIPAIKRGIAKTREGTPALLEFITEQAVDFSRFA